MESVTEPNTVTEPSLSLSVVGKDSTGVSLYEYDKRNRLTKALGDNSTAEYAYNVNGLRKSKTVNGTTTGFIWDGMNMIAETSNGSITSNYAYDITGIAMLNRGTANQYYLKNAHGDVTGLAAESGVVLTDYAYDAFGNQLNSTTETDPFRYCGEYCDEETDSIYLRNRYYSTTMGRFITEDPIKDGLNWYAYCENNPVNKIDPSGLKGESGLGLMDILKLFAENHESDKQGLQILRWYLFGGGENHFIDNDPEWTKYMEANTILKSQIKTVLLGVFNDMENSSSQWLDMTLQISIENGENAIGYEFLHGTNNDLQAYKALGATVDDVGFRIIGNVRKDSEGVVEYSLAFEWNDIIDPNFEYASDKAKSEIAKKIPGADPQNYILRIKWNKQGVYNEQPGFSWTTWPFSLWR